MKKVLKGLFLLLLLFVMAGCSSATKNHAEAIENLFNVEEIEDSSGDSSDEKSKSKGEDVEASTFEEADSSSSITGSAGLTVDEMREILIEEGVLSADSTYYNDTMIKELFSTSGLVGIDNELWNAVLKASSFDDLEGQIKEQYDEQNEKDKERSKYTYKVSVQLPNVEKVKLKSVKVDAPEYDYDDLYTHTDYHTAYQTDVANALQTSLREHLNSDKKQTLKKHEFTVVVTEKDDDEYAAVIDEEDLRTIKKAIKDQEASFLENSEKLPEMEHAVLVKNIKSSLESKVPSELAPKIKDVSEGKKDKEYIVKMQYIKGLPDSLNKIRDAYNNDAKSKYPDGMYTAVPEDTIKTNLLKRYASEDFNYADEKEITVQKNGLISIEFDSEAEKDLQESIQKENDRIVAEIKKYHDENLLNKVQERPGTGVISGGNSGNPVAIETPSNSRDYFVKFLTEDGSQVVLSAYLRAGENLTVNLPSGNMKMRFASGDGGKWYGDKLTFGPDGSYSEASEIISVQNGASYSLTLYGVSGGNLPIDSLDQGNF